MLKNYNKSVCILLTDSDSVNDFLIIKSLSNLKKSRIKTIYFIGDKNKFLKVYKISKLSHKFKFINCEIQKKNYYKYLNEITHLGIKLFRKKKIKFLINMPLNKKKFLKKKYEGYTEFFSYKFDKKKNENMLLYNNKFSVCPLTTHIQIKNIEKKINKLKILNSIKNINNFFKNYLNQKVKIIVLGLNPHASQDMSKNNIDNSLIKPIVNKLKKNKIDIHGPVSADTAFDKTKNKIYIGMYHDQVLIPFKMVNKFNGINITIGKKLLRLSPDHGTGTNIKNKKKLINNMSFINCIKFCEKFINV